MASKLYPAVLEKAEKKTFAVWFPDFPDCVAAGRSPDEAVEKAQARLSDIVDGLAEQDREMPEPTAMDAIARPKNFLAFVMISMAPPDPSERVNVYLPKRLIAKVDARAADLGMSRSSFFGFALSVMLGTGLAPGALPAGSLLAQAFKGVTAPKPRR